MDVSRAGAERILCEKGWLSAQPARFRAEVLRRAELVKFAPGASVYRLNDALGGIYGIVSGMVLVTTAPRTEAPRSIHLGEPGFWVGEGCFLSREARRVEVNAFVETVLMHLPLAAMDEMAASDPSAVRRFALIVMANLDTLVRIIHDLQKPQAAKRISSVLQRFSAIGDRPIPLSQTELGDLANASRKQVNAAIRELAARSCVRAKYRSIEILDAESLRRFASEED